MYGKISNYRPPKSLISSFASVNRNRIIASAIMKKLNNGCHFFNIDHMEKYPITDPPKVWVSGFLSVNRNRISASAIMKNWKMAAISLISIIRKNIQVPIPQSLGLRFSECWRKQNISIGHYWRCKFSFFWIFHWFIFPHHQS